jgi:hypothetical protein
MRAIAVPKTNHLLFLLDADEANWQPGILGVKSGKIFHASRATTGSSSTSICQPISLS